MKKIILFLIIAFSTSIYSQREYGSDYSGVEIDSAAGQFIGETYTRLVGNADKKYPLTVTGLQNAIASLDSGDVYISYPGIWDTTGLGAIPNTINIWGWLFGTLNIRGVDILYGDAFVSVWSANIRISGNVEIVGWLVIDSFNGIIQKNGGDDENWIGSFNFNDTDSSGRGWYIRQAGNLGGRIPGDLYIQFYNGTDFFDVWRMSHFNYSAYYLGDIQQKINIDNVSNPPTDAELDSAYPNAINGETFYIDDADGHTNFYQVVKITGGWMIFTGTKAL